jgi:hypothetical protein
LRKTRNRNIEGFSVDVSKKTTNLSNGEKAVLKTHNNNYTNSNAILKNRKMKLTGEWQQCILEAKVQAIKSIR